MIWILLMALQRDIGELQTEANQAFAKSVAAENEKSIKLLELQVKVTEASKEESALKRTIRE